MKKISLNVLLIAAFAVTLLTASAMAYYYGLRKAPTVVENVKTRVAVTAAPAMPPKFLYNITGKNPDNEMNEPLSVTVAGNGRVFVADSGNARIQAYDPNGGFLFQFGQEGPDEARLEMPVTVAWRSGLLYVGDIRRNAILIFDEVGKFQRAISGQDLGISLSPLAIAFDGQTMFVASGPGYVYMLDEAGKLVGTIGQPGGPDGYLGYPNGVTLVDGNVVVSDSNNQRIQVFSKSGDLLTVKNDLGLSLPRGAVVDRLGRLFVVDTFGHTVVALDKEMKQLFRFGSRGTEEGQFNFPNQLATDDAGRLYIADRENNRIVVYGY